MAGNVDGGKQAARTNKKRFGKDFYSRIGKLGGLKSRGGGFAYSYEAAAKAGRLGGKAKRKPKEEVKTGWALWLTK